MSFSFPSFVSESARAANIGAAAEFTLPRTHFFGRTLAEYRRIFALDEARDLAAGARVLDVAAGPSSFNAEATARGVRATSVDPLYGLRREAVELAAREDHARVAAQMRAKPGLMRPGAGSFPDLESAIAERRAAAERFLGDYEDGFLQGRYVGGALPALPFADGAEAGGDVGGEGSAKAGAGYDLVLCGRLLFLHAGLFDHAFHVAACRELVRVTRAGGEARVHPLCGGDGRRYARLEELRAELAAEGIESEVRPVRGAFFHAADATLVLRRAVRFSKGMKTAHRLPGLARIGTAAG